MRAAIANAGVLGRGAILAIALLAGLTLSAGPLLGTMVSVIQVLHVHAAAAARGDALAPDSVHFPLEPILIGFAALVPGFLLLTFTVLRYSRRVKLRRLSGLD
jgi:hypothetical protein